MKKIFFNNQPVLAFIILIISFSFLFSSSFVKKEKFEIYISKAGLQLTVPDGFKKTRIRKNRNQSYDFAVLNRKLKTEIRYKVWVYDSVMKEMAKKTPGYTFSKAQLWVIVRNLTESKREDYIEFPTESVKSEFGADWGATSSIELSCDFGKGYRYCSITALHKDTTADAYVFYLYDDPAQVQKMFNDVSNNWFYTLTFKK